MSAHGPSTSVRGSAAIRPESEAKPQYLADLGAWNLILLGGFSIAIILIDKRGLWGLIRRVLPDDLIAIAHKPSAAFEPAPKRDRKS
jgi:hypothetical protein